MDQENGRKKPARFERSPDTDLLMSALRKVEVGQTATYPELSAVISRDVQRLARSNLQSARKALEAQDGIVFEAVHNSILDAVRLAAPFAAHWPATGHGRKRR